MKCFECGEMGGLHLHHVVPRSLGGTKTVPLCERCHGVVHGRSLNTSALTRKAMQHKRARLEYTGGHVRYGYRVAGDGVSLVPDPAEQEVIAKAVEYRAAGLSLRRTAERLEQRGFVTRRGRRFSAKAVRTIVKQSENR